MARYTRLFRFYDRDGDGVHTLSGDFTPVAERINARWGDRSTPSPNLLQLLLDTYAHENSRRDSDGSGSGDRKEFIDSPGRVLTAFLASPG
ncbi:MAG: EF-hand domain-containing protein, partial [Vulcanococcus sp.]